MDSASLVRNGITYITAKAAAPVVGISADYITKLCRKGDVDALLVGNAWYVDQASVAAFVAHKETTKREHAARNAQQIREATRRAEEIAQAEIRETRVSQHPRHARTNPAYAFSVATVVLLVAMSAGTFAFSSPNQQSQLLAAASATLPAPIQNTLDRTATVVFDFFCPLFSACDSGSAVASAPAITRTVTAQRPITATSTPEQSVQPPQPTIIQRIVEKTETIVQAASAGITEQLLDARLAALEASFSGRIERLAYQGDRQAQSLADSFADGIGGGGFDDIDITDSTFTGGSISGASISGGSIANASLSSITFSGETDFTSLTVDTATSTNATSTNLYVSGSFGFGSGTGLLRNDTGTVSTLTNGSNGQVLKIVGGNLAWSTDLTGGGGGGASFFASTTDDLAIYPADPDDVLLIGTPATTTSGNILEVSGNSLFRGAATSYGLLTSPRFTATSSIASIFPYASTTALSAATLCLSSDCRNDWPTDTAFSTTSADAWKSERNFFSTSSSNYWKSVTDLFSTTSASFFLTQNQEEAFSTTSASYFLSQNGSLGFSTTSATYFANASTTIPKTYTSNTFTALQTFANASTTNISASYASSTQGFFGSLSIGNLTGILRATAGAISAALVDLASDINGILPVSNGGTGWANIASAAIPYGNGSGALATTSAGTNGQVLALLGGVPTWTATSTLSTISGTLDVSRGGTGANSFAYGLVLSPGGTSALTNIATSSLGLLTTHVAEGSNLYYTDARVGEYIAASTSLASSLNYWTLSGGNVYRASGNVGIGEANPNTKLHVTAADSGFAPYVHSNLTIEDNDGVSALAFIGPNTQQQMIMFGDGQASNAGGISFYHPQNRLDFYGGSTTAFTLGNQERFTILSNGNIGIGSSTPGTMFAIGSSTNAINLNPYATSTFARGINLTSGCFAINGTCITGGGGSSFDYPFPSNATSTTLTFSNGLLALASTTIGNGTQAGGLTISGGATTTGALKVLGTGTSTFAGGISMSGDIIPSADNTYSLGSATNMWRDVFIGPGSLYINGKKVLEDVSNVITFSTDSGQNLAIETAGTGNINAEATGSGNLNLLSGSGNISITSTSGNLNIGTTGSGQLNLGTVTAGTWHGSPIGAAYGGTGSTTLSGIIKGNGSGVVQTAIPGTDYLLPSALAGYANFGYLFPSNATSTLLSFNGGLTTSAMTLGTLNGPLHANAGVLSATSSIGVLYGGTGLTSAPAYGEVLVGDGFGGYTLTATSSLGIAGGGSLTGTEGQVPYFSGTNTAVGTSSLVIASNGSIGIGTTSPTSRLHVFESSGNAGMRFQSGDGIADLITTGDHVYLSNYKTDGFIVHGTTGAGAHHFYTNSVFRMGIQGDGGIFIGQSSSANPADDNVAGAYFTADGTLSLNRSGAQVAHFGRAQDGALLTFYSAGTAEGAISISGTTVSYGAFTGSHFATTDETIERGELVSLTGEQIFKHGTSDSEPTYKVLRTAQENDPAVFGSYLALAEPLQPHDPIENPFLIMAVGNGDMWVVQGEEESIEPGNYLISSAVPGHAMKDPGTHAVAHIVARAAQRVDWANISPTTDANGNAIKRAKISVTFEQFDRVKSLADALAALTATSSATSSPQSELAQSFFSSLFTRITQWLADASNGIQTIITQVLKSHRVETVELCVGSVCVTESQFMSVFGSGTQGGNTSQQSQTAAAATPSPQNPSGDATQTAQTGNANWTNEPASPEPQGNDQAPPPPAEATNDNQAPSSEPQAANDNPEPAAAETTGS